VVLAVGQIAQSLRSKTAGHCPEFQNPNQILPTVKKVVRCYNDMLKAKNLVHSSPSVDAEFFNEIYDQSMKAKKLILPKYEKPKPKPAEN